MNKKGFTLAELLAVIVVLALVMMLVVPGVSSLKRANDKKQYQTYGDMMIEYAKTLPLHTLSSYNGNNEKKYACLNDLNMQPINANITCNGYVLITNNGKTFKSYLFCKNKKDELTYKTPDYETNLPSGC